VLWEVESQDAPSINL